MNYILYLLQSILILILCYIFIIQIFDFIKYDYTFLSKQQKILIDNYGFLPKEINFLDKYYINNIIWKYTDLIKGSQFVFVNKNRIVIEDYKIYVIDKESNYTDYKEITGKQLRNMILEDISYKIKEENQLAWQKTVLLNNFKER